MRIVQSARRSKWLALSITMLAAVATLAAQTPQAPTITVATTTLQFGHQIGRSAPPAQVLRVHTAPGNVAFTATAASTGGWLLVNDALGTSGTSGTPSADVRVSVNPAAFQTVQTLQGTITISAGSTTKVVNVNLTIGTTPQLSLNPSGLNVNIEAAVNRDYQIAVSSTDPTTNVAFNATVVNQEPLTNWLVVTPNTGNSGTSATITINAQAIPIGMGLVVGAVRFQVPNPGGGAVTLPVSVLVGEPAQFVVSPTSLTFPYQVSFSAPTNRMVNVTSSGSGQLFYTASVTAAQNWLTLATSNGGTGSQTVTNTTPNPFYLIPNVAAVSGAPGNYDAEIRIEGPVGTTAKTITARLSITNTPQLTVFQDPVPFSYTLGGVIPTAQSITINATSGNLPISVTEVIPEGGVDWFNVAPVVGATPANLQVSVDATRLPTLAAGTYPGAVRVASGALSVDVPVSLTVSGSTLITVEGGPFTFQGRQGETPTSRTVIIRSTDATNQPFTLAVDPTTASWLVLDRTSGSTGTTGTVISINANPLAVSNPGIYEANIVITPTGIQGASPYRVPVTYTVTGTSNVTANPASVELTQTGTTPPAAQTIRLETATPGTQFTVQAAGLPAWLKVAPTTGTVPGSLTLTFESGSLQPGVYEHNLVISAAPTTLQIPVKLTVAAAGTLSVTPATLTYAHTVGAATPAAQTLNLTSSGGALPFTAVAASTGNWLSVSPASGTTAAQGGAATPLSVTVNPANLTPGSYQGTVTVNAPGATNATTTVSVTLTVSAVVVPNTITLVHSATASPGFVSPGQLITLYGRNMAPATQNYARVVNNVVQTTLADVRVTFNGQEAPLLYVGPGGGGVDQINAVVPYGVGNQVNTRLVVEYKGQRSEALDFRVAETQPGIYTQNQSGTGLGAILNQDNNVNSAASPARVGQIIQIYATGEGAVSPAGQNGLVPQTAAELRRPMADVKAFVNGVEAQVQYAGSAPGLVSGAFQVNVWIPANAGISAATQVPIEIQVGTNRSQRGVTVAVAP